MSCETPGMLGVVVTKRLTVTYDAIQHCIAEDPMRHKTLRIDSPLTGRGRELSPTLLLASALASSILLSMGAVARRHGIDLTGSHIEAEVSMASDAVAKIDAIDLTCHFARAMNQDELDLLRRTAMSSGIRQTLDGAVPVSIQFALSEAISASPRAAAP